MGILQDGCKAVWVVPSFCGSFLYFCASYTHTCALMGTLLKSWHLLMLSSIFDKFVGLDDSFFFLEVLNSKNVKVYWERKGKADVTGANQVAFDGIPYVHIGEKILWCHQGKDKGRKRLTGYKVIHKNLSFLWDLFYENSLTQQY